MKIGFDARMIGHPGIGRYIRNLLTAMVPIADGSEFLLYGECDKLSDFKTCERKKCLTSAYSLKEFFISPFNKDSLDIIHVPHFNAPFNNKNRLVVTIHDLIYIKFQESRPRFVPDILARGIISRAVKRAESIIAVSENTKKDIVENFPFAAKKVKVIHEAADPIFKKIDDEGKKDAVRKRYKLPGDFILCVSSLKKHKNIERLIDAYVDLKKRGINHRLVIVGRYRPREADILKKIRSSDAIYLGEVSADELVLIYNLADLMVVPSLYEGFGLPALEAMASGIPLAVSSVSSLPEVVGDAAVFFDPYDVKDISDKVYHVLNDEALRRSLIDKGSERVSNFSWEKTARGTLEVYKEVLS